MKRKWNPKMAPYIYTGGTVYEYDEKWRFNKIGLWQWVDPTFTSGTTDQSTKIPTQMDKERLTRHWKKSTDQKIRWWKKYLNIDF
jgi:hypothetical protein